MLIIHLKLFKSPMEYFRMNLHASIAFRVGSAPHVPKSPMAYIETNLNMGIAFWVGSTPQVI